MYMAGIGLLLMVLRSLRRGLEGSLRKGEKGVKKGLRRVK